MAKREKGERSIIAPKGGRIVHTGKFRLPDGTIRTMPELAVTNIKTPKKMQSGGMAGASPAEIRDEKERQRKENRRRASERRDGQKAAKPLDIDKTPGKPASNFEQARNFSRLAEIDELRRQEEKRRKERVKASRATVGMGPAKITTGGGLGMMTTRDRSKPKLLKKGGAVCRGGRSAERGTQFRGVR